MSLKLGQKGAFLMLEKYLTRIRRLKSRCLRGMFTSRLKDTDSILFCCIVKNNLWFFFPVFFHQLSLSFDSTFLHVLFPTFSVIFLINVIPSVLAFFLFTIIQVLIDFFRRSFFLSKSFEGERSEIYLTFFFQDTLRG